MAPYYHSTILVQARGEHDASLPKHVPARRRGAPQSGPGNLVHVKGQQAGLDGNIPVGSDVDLSGQYRHVQDHQKDKAPAQAPNGRGILVYLLVLDVKEYYGKENRREGDGQQEGNQPLDLDTDAKTMVFLCFLDKEYDFFRDLRDLLVDDDDEGAAETGDSGEALSCVVWVSWIW
eukprot:CAMPEP_0197274516 /NCGR_PEP_ID=MMETSP1432-20130617/12789_1 /TAXON_ID=44447 /ORGANISM="Pseudo-nitzschia delicatissima, Strain UNC1205" /LENGTH=175 /DNA_ID=CAMNT_0042740321 /DNA_START=224 /DNA_END=749 /DNA_ORIENTATION=+